MKVWKYGDNINTDMLFPGKYTYTCSTAEEIKPHLLEDLDPSFSKNVVKGDIIFAGKNFGCGSSREQPVVGLKAVGIKVVVAESFARIFYRSAINQGLPVIVHPDAVSAYHTGDRVVVDFAGGTISVGKNRFPFEALPDKLMQILDSKGLVNWIRGQ